jgi:hypothetical protein
MSIIGHLQILEQTSPRIAKLRLPTKNISQSQQSKQPNLRVTIGSQASLQISLSFNQNPIQILLEGTAVQNTKEVGLDQDEQKASLLG